MSWRRLEIDYDERNDIVTIDGIKYAGTFFRGMGRIQPSDRPFRIVERKDGLVTLEDVWTEREPEI